MSPHDKIFLDSQRAHDYASKYLAALDGEMFARCLMFTSAMQKFGEFLHLPEADSKLKRIFETALTVLAAVQPELFFVKFLGEEEKAVKVALAIGEATGSKTAKAIVIAGKVGEGAEKLKGGVEKYDAYQEKKEKRRQVPEAALKLKQLDAGKKPVLQMLAAYSKAQGIWSDAIDALDKELENRLNANATAPPPKEALEAMAQRLLKIPEPFSPDELEQLETSILWQFATAWAHTYVKIVETRTMNNAYASNTVEYEGVNDTQQETLQDWFGFEAKRGRNFFQPPTLPNYPKLTLARLGAPTVSKVVSYPYAGR